MSARVINNDGVLVATFTDRESAMLCLPAMARVLRETLCMEVLTRTKKSFVNPLPRGVFREGDEHGIVVTLIARP